MSEFNTERGIAAPEDDSMLVDAYFVEDETTDRVALNLKYLLGGEVHEISIMDWFKPDVVTLSGNEGQL